MKNRVFRVLMGMFIFLVVCVSITTILILNERAAQRENENHIPAVTLLGTYDENSISLQKVDILPDEENDPELHYYQISGLKDKTVENSINNQIKEMALRLSQCFSSEEYQNCELYQTIFANFANVLCFEIYATAETHTLNEFGTPYSESKIEYHAFNLADGSEIKFQDLFMDDTDIIAILSSEIYEDLMWDSKYMNMPEDGDYATYWDSITEKIDETKLVAGVKKLSDTIRDGTIPFYFTPQYICITGDTYLSLDMEKYISDIAIYTRFLTEDSIYEDDTLGTKGLFNFSIREFSDDILLWDCYGPQTDNLFVDGKLINWLEKENENAIYRQIYQNIVSLAEEDKENEITFANSNPSKKIYTGFAYTLTSYGTDNRLITVEKNYERYVMDASYYDEIFLDILARSYRNDTRDGGINDIIYIYYEENAPIEETRNSTTYYYSKKNGKEIKEISDCFIDGYNYDSLFRDVFLRNMLNEKRAQENLPAITDEELEKQYQNTRFVFDGSGYGIYVLNDELGYTSYEEISYYYSNYKILFSDLNEDYLNI